MRACLTYLRQSEKLSKNVIDGWDLIHVGLAAVRELAPKSWTTSFKKVNLHPFHRVTFPEWCVRIAHFLQGGQSFRAETSLPDSYLLLPAFWRGMPPEDKQRSLDILNHHNGAYTTDCVTQLHTEMHVPIPDLQNLRVCLSLAIEHPDHITRSPELAEVGAAAGFALPEVVTQAQTAMTDVNDGLQSFQLHPTRNGKQLLTGLAKFEHMVKLARRCNTKDTAFGPSPFLDVECSATQKSLLDPSPQDFMMHTIMAQADGAGAKQSLSKRKLDALGNMRGTCGFANDPERLKRLQSQLELSSSLASIARAVAKERTESKSQQTAEMVALAPAAILKFVEKGEELDKLTKAEIKAIAFTHFGGAVLKDSDSKPVLVEQLRQLMTAQPTVRASLVANAKAVVTAAAADATTATQGRATEATAGTATAPHARKKRVHASSDEESSSSAAPSDSSRFAHAPTV